MDVAVLERQLKEAAGLGRPRRAGRRPGPGGVDPVRRGPRGCAGRGRGARTRSTTTWWWRSARPGHAAGRRRGDGRGARWSPRTGSSASRPGPARPWRPWWPAAGHCGSGDLAPFLDDASRVVFARRLLREGVLRRAWLSDETCSSCSLAYDEDPGGTASRQRSWLLIEQPGAWGRNALLESKLPRARSPGRSTSAAGRPSPGAAHPARAGRPSRPSAGWAFVRATAERPGDGRRARSPSPRSCSTSTSTALADRRRSRCPAPAPARCRRLHPRPPRPLLCRQRPPGGPPPAPGRASTPGSAPTSAATASRPTWSRSPTASSTAGSRRRRPLPLVHAYRRGPDPPGRLPGPGARGRRRPSRPRSCCATSWTTGRSTRCASARHDIDGGRHTVDVPPPGRRDPRGRGRRRPWTSPRPACCPAATQAPGHPRP